MEHQKANVTLGLTRKSLEAVKILACPKCRAPGVYSNGESIRQNWPACYDPQRAQQPVGSTCPQCGTKRPSNKNLGELTASMPLFVWKLALGFKWVLIQTTRIKQHLFPQGGI